MWLFFPPFFCFVFFPRLFCSIVLSRFWAFRDKGSRKTRQKIAQKNPQPPKQKLLIYVAFFFLRRPLKHPKKQKSTSQNCHLFGSGPLERNCLCCSTGAEAATAATGMAAVTYSTSVDTWDIAKDTPCRPVGPPFRA
jgi:hypothetical protein